MNRKTKIIINILLIISIFFGYFYYIHGYYISKQECIDDSLKAFYNEHTNIPVLSFSNNKSDITLYTDIKNSKFTVLEISKHFLFYKCDESESSYNDIDKALAITWIESKEMGLLFFAYRVDKNIDTVEIVFTNGTVVKNNEWYGDYCGFYSTKDCYLDFSCRVYDMNNNLIETVIN